MERFCRGCLIKYEDPVELVQYTEKNRRLYVYSTSIQVKRNDTFTFQLCKDCYLNMRSACKFKKQCRTSDKRLRNYLALKEAGETFDFSTFLKKNDDSLTFRLPLLSGSSTPANYKPKDDDNESTCTSIRNFMTDIFRVDEIPDTEARIIREVIEEETDVLDDSLDSHWLQEDASIDTDFRLDFSFSPFATPRSVNNGCYTPQQVKDDYITIKDEFQDPLLPDNDIPAKIDEIVKNNENTVNIDNVLNNLQMTKENYELCMNSVKTEENKVDTIDRNIENALENDNKEYLLDDVLVTPPVHRTSAASTPTIKNILFGDNLETNGEQNDSQHKAGYYIEKYEEIEGDLDMLEEFLDLNETEKFPLQEELIDTEGMVPESVSLEMKYDLSNLLCKLCDIKFDSITGLKEHFVKSHKVSINNKEQKNVPNTDKSLEMNYDLSELLCTLCNKKFKSTKALKIHFARRHKVSIKDNNKRVDPRNGGICNFCGKEFKDYRNLRRHNRVHEKKRCIQKCKKCLLEFSSAVNLRMHMQVHAQGQTNDEPIKRDPRCKEYICTICGCKVTTAHTLTLHMRRHSKNYSHKCMQCDKAFYRKSDLTLHERSHIGLKQFKCPMCDKSFARRDTLNKHLKLHTGEGLSKCEYCNITFVSKGHIHKHLQTSKRCLKIRDLKTTCKFCNSNFNSNDDLSNHLKTSVKCLLIRNPDLDNNKTPVLVFQLDDNDDIMVIKENEDTNVVVEKLTEEQVVEEDTVSNVQNDCNIEEQDVISNKPVMLCLPDISQ